MNTDNLGVNNDPYGHHHHHHLTHPHLLPPQHSSSALYCPTSTSYSELFSPFPTDFINSHENGNPTHIPSEYLTLQNPLDYVVSHQHHQNTERTSAINGSNVSPSHSFTTNGSYSSAADYYNTSLLSSKSVTNNNRNNTPTNTNNHSPYDGTSTASTSSPPQSTNYLNTTVKQETMMSTPFTVDLHNNYGTNFYSISIQIFSI